jgi:hypothetical protein
VSDHRKSGRQNVQRRPHPPRDSLVSACRACFQNDPPTKLRRPRNGQVPSSGVPPCRKCPQEPRAACAAAAVRATTEPNVIGSGTPNFRDRRPLSDHHWVPKQFHHWSPPLHPYLAQRVAQEHRNDLLRDVQQWRLANVPGPKAQRRATWWPQRSGAGANRLVTVAAGAQRLALATSVSLPTPAAS